MAERPTPGTDTIFVEVYDRLHELAERWMRREPEGHTLQPTALVHEAFLRLRQEERIGEDREEFLRFAAIAMRRILVERARRVRTLRRGRDHRRAPLSQIEVAVREAPVDVLALDEALERLAEIAAGYSDIAILRFLLGCSLEETASVLGLSTSKVKKDWRFVRSWLKVELGSTPE